MCRTKDEARHAEGELLRDLKAEAAARSRVGARPATLKTLFEFYVADPEARGKGTDTIGRAVATAKAVEALTPELLDKPVGRVGQAGSRTSIVTPCRRSCGFGSRVRAGRRGRAAPA